MWTPIPADFAEQIKKVFTQQFKREAQLGEFLIEGCIYSEEVVLRIGYLEKGRLKQVNFEASMDLPKASTEGDEDADDISSLSDDMSADAGQSLGQSLAPGYGETNASPKAQSKAMDRVYTCIDAIGSLMEEYFQLGDEEELDVPLRWRAYEFEGETVYLQHSTVNTKLEEEADRLLGLSENALVHEEAATDDALANAEIDTELAKEIQKAIREGRIKLSDLGIELEHDETGHDAGPETH
jgi:hypothetical protein